MKLLWTLLLGGVLPIVAAEPFTGTWKLDVSQAKFSEKPQKIELAKGIYTCSACDPPITVKADGTDQPVAGHPDYDTMNVRITDDHGIQITGKKDGKVAFDQKATLSPDAMTVTFEFTSHPPSSDKPVSGSMTMKRVGSAPSVAGMHAISGAWVPGKIESISENGLMVTFEQTDDGLKMNQATGERYDARFDGKEYPYEGSAGVNKVVLKKVSQRVIEETDKRNGRMESTARMTVSQDGHSMTMVIRDRQARVSTFVFNKQ